VNTTVSGTATPTVDGNPADNTGTAPLVVLAPVLTIAPKLGPPGFVAAVTGRNFPPGSRVTLSWNVGISSVPQPIVVRADGTFTVPILIFHKDRLGPRRLSARPAPPANGGTPTPAFAPVGDDFLVVPGVIQPPDQVMRR